MLESESGIADLSNNTYAASMRHLAESLGGWSGIVLPFYYLYQIFVLKDAHFFVFENTRADRGRIAPFCFIVESNQHARGLDSGASDYTNTSQCKAGEGTEHSAYLNGDCWIFGLRGVLVFCRLHHAVHVFIIVAFSHRPRCFPRVTKALSLSCSLIFTRRSIPCSSYVTSAIADARRPFTGMPRASGPVRLPPNEGWNCWDLGFTIGGVAGVYPGPCLHLP